MKGALSLDLDNKWSYMKTHGDAGWERLPSYLDILIPRALELLRELQVRITFFVVGQDAALDYNREAFALISPAGHEVGNHSYYHEPWMNRRTQHEIDEELALAEDSIQRATGKMPRGFRGPGFVRSPALTEVLAKRGYLYDASSLPTFIGPLARAYYLRTSKMHASQRTQRDDLFGHFSDGLHSNRPHRIRAGGRILQELPVTTMPGLRLPIHVSYVLYIAALSPRLAVAYFRTALALCRLTGTQPSILLHPLDFLSIRECPELGFFPGMDLDPGVKRHVLRTVLHIFVRNFDVMPLEQVILS